MYLNKLLAAVCVVAFSLTVVPALAVAAEKAEKTSAKRGKTYGEEEFLAKFQNKSRKQVSDVLGKPVRTGQGSKPSNAEATWGRPMKKEKGQVDNVEMWYYEDMVNYDPKHTYKTVELTFVNDRCLNITYFNNR